MLKKIANILVMSAILVSMGILFANQCEFGFHDYQYDYQNYNPLSMEYTKTCSRCGHEITEFVRIP